MPEWLAVEFMKRYRAVTHAQVASWDEAFGRQYSKGTHLSALRREREMGPKIYRAVEAARHAGAAVDKILFEEVGEEFGLGATLTGELYYKEAKLPGRVSPRRRIPRKA